MDWPDVTVLIVTYDRPAEIRKTLGGLVKHLKYSGKLRWHLADDGSPDGYIEGVRQDYPNLQLSLSQTDREGWGINVNTAMAAIKTPYIFLCEDDYLAQWDVNFDSGVALMEAEPKVGLVRYDGIKGWSYVLNERKAETGIGEVKYIVLDKEGSKCPYVYSNRPHLKHKRFHESYGKYAEGKVLAETENDYVWRYKNQKEGPMVVALDNGVDHAFEHFGKSRQSTEFDLETVQKKKTGRKRKKEAAPKAAPAPKAEPVYKKETSAVWAAIVSTQSSGAHILEACLRSHPDVGGASGSREVLLDWSRGSQADPTQVLHGFFTQGSEQVRVGILMYNHLMPTKVRDWLLANGIKVVHLIQEDHVLQAVSHHLMDARKTGRAEVNVPDVVGRIAGTKANIDRFRKVFEGGPYLEVTYKELVRNDGAKASIPPVKTADRLLRFLGLSDRSLTVPAFEKYPAPLHRTVINYDVLMEAVSGR